MLRQSLSFVVVSCFFFFVFDCVFLDSSFSVFVVFCAWPPLCSLNSFVPRRYFSSRASSSLLLRGASLVSFWIDASRFYTSCFCLRASSRTQACFLCCHLTFFGFLCASVCPSLCFERCGFFKCACFFVSTLFFLEACAVRRFVSSSLFWVTRVL